MQNLDVQLKVPDFWQQQTVKALQNGHDVVLSAPTGAGKTYVFEQFIDSGFSGRAVYTVPTRALANDKRLEWLNRGWNVGIATGDRSENTTAPIIVATLETQKNRLLKGIGPSLMVIDEYQMLGDAQRGLNYELSIASAPPDTQLLLLSGSVGNPKHVRDWLRKLGRKSTLIVHTERPVPLEEVRIESLPDRIPPSVKGFWPRAIARVLRAEMAPLLAFAPRRKAAEDLAIQIARMLPEEDPLILTPEQQRIAGDPLKRLLKARVAFHHSGLDYAQRAGLVEPLAKAGQLRVVVATMGLAAGINFSMRSVLVTDREYRSSDRTHRVRPDELLQMFGRAGRRGLDKIGYIAVAKGKPRLAEARPLHLQRSNELDWPSIISVMQQAIVSDSEPLHAARELTAKLFSNQRVFIGLRDFKVSGPTEKPAPTREFKQTVQEFQNPDGNWERKRAPKRVTLNQTFIFRDDHWLPFLNTPDALDGVPAGRSCRLNKESPPLYGREVPVARVARKDEKGELILTKWSMRQLKEFKKKEFANLSRYNWSLNAVEKDILPLLPFLTQGGRFQDWREYQDVMYARLDYRHAETFAVVDSKSRALLFPPEREVVHEANLDLPEDETLSSKGSSPADAWFQLGLMDAHAAPTRRGILFSFFNYGEGLSIAAALEDESYPIEELIIHLANIRAGHRFSEHELSSGRLGMVCRSTYRNATFAGYLNKGVPTTYGDGAAEILQMGRKAFQKHYLSEELRTGDIERAKLEWHSLLRHIAHAPEMSWGRWMDLKDAAMEIVQQLPPPLSLDSLPSLTPTQKQRHKSFLRFEETIHI